MSFDVPELVSYKDNFNSVPSMDEYSTIMYNPTSSQIEQKPSMDDTSSEELKDVNEFYKNENQKIGSLDELLKDLDE